MNDYSDLEDNDEYSDSLPIGATDGMDIKVSQDYMGYWSAIDANIYDGAPDSPLSSRIMGHGRTEGEAIRDLVFQIREMEQDSDRERWDSLRETDRTIPMSDDFLPESRKIDVISKLITESSSWRNQRILEIEELEDSSLGNYMFNVKFTIGYSCAPGEEMVRYYPDGSGYPGSPPECEWEILSINSVDVYDERGDEATINDTPDLQEKIKAAIYKVIDDDKIMEVVGGDYEETDEAWERD